MYLLAAPGHFEPLPGKRAYRVFQALSPFEHPLAHTRVWDGILQFLPYLHVVDVHPRPLLPDKDVVDVNQNVPLQGERQLLSRQEGDGVDEDELVEPEGQVVPKEDSLDAVVQAQVLDDGCIESSPGQRGWGGPGGLQLAQEHGLVGGMVELEHRPVLAGQGALLHPGRFGDAQQGRPRVHHAVSEGHVVVQLQWQPFQSGARGAVLVGFMKTNYANTVFHTVFF